MLLCKCVIIVCANGFIDYRVNQVENMLWLGLILFYAKHMLILKVYSPNHIILVSLCYRLWSLDGSVVSLSSVWMRVKFEMFKTQPWIKAHLASSSSSVPSVSPARDSYTGAPSNFRGGARAISIGERPSVAVCEMSKSEREGSAVCFQAA